MPGIIQTDTRQQMQRKHHQAKQAYFESQGYQVLHSKMLVGDYCIPGKGNVAVDTKQNLTELYGNLIQDHERFRNECILAKDCGIRLVVLIENDEGYTKLEDIKRWKNPQMYRWYKARRKAINEHKKIPKPPASNVQLLKIMHSMSRDYAVEFRLCPRISAGEAVLNILES